MAGRWDNKNNLHEKYTDDEIEMMLSIQDIDDYDQALMELKRLVNERKKFPKNYEAYDIAIKKLILGINEFYEEGDLPQQAVERDIDEALKGGKYRILVKNTKEYPDIIDLRKKRISKPKPKRKPVKKVVKKVVKKCKCK
jgi:hypothetical protein